MECGGGREGGRERSGLTILRVVFWWMGVELNALMVKGGARGCGMRAFARMDRRRRGSILEDDEGERGESGGRGVLEVRAREKVSFRYDFRKFE